MTRMPGAEWRPLTEAETQARIKPTQVIYHSIVGTGPSARDFFEHRTGLESHFIVLKSGAIWQLMDTDRQADANLNANRRPDGTGAISVETEDNGHPDSDPWTPAQLDALAAIARWANAEYGVPLIQCSGPNAPGLGWHVMWGAPGPWTPVAKTCPGEARIAQLPELFARLTVQEDDEMTPEQDQMLRDLKAKVDAIDDRTSWLVEWKDKIAIPSLDSIRESLATLLGRG